MSLRLALTSPFRGANCTSAIEACLEADFARFPSLLGTGRRPTVRSEVAPVFFGIAVVVRHPFGVSRRKLRTVVPIDTSTRGWHTRHRDYQDSDLQHPARRRPG